MAAEKIRYKDMLDYAERLSFSGVESKEKQGEYLLDLISKIDEKRANNGREKETYLNKDEIDYVIENGFETEPFWMFLKDGKTPEYGSPLTDYQDAYIEYIANPLRNRVENFEELKNAENAITEIGAVNYLKYAGLARGEDDISKWKKRNDMLGDVPYVKQIAYGRNGLRGQLDAVYEDLSRRHAPELIENLRKLESIVGINDISTNNAQLYATSEFVKDSDGKEVLLYTVNAPILKTNKMDEFRASDNEALTFKVTENGIEGAKYTDFNLYYDDLEVEVPAPNGKTSVKTGKKAADYLKENPNEDYPDPDRVQQVKIDNVAKWVYVLPDMSYPEKDAAEPFTKDYAGVQSSIVSDRLKTVGKEIEKLALTQDKSKNHGWQPKTAHQKEIQNEFRL